MKHLNKFNESKDEDNEKNIIDEKKNAVILRLADIVMEEISGDSVHPSEYFDALDLYLLAFGEERFLHICNILLDERINRDDTRIRLDLNTMEVMNNDEYHTAMKAKKVDKTIHYNKIYTLLSYDRGRITRYLAQWDDVKKIKNKR